MDKYSKPQLAKPPFTLSRKWTNIGRGKWETDFLSSAGAGGECVRPMSLPDPSPVLDKNRAPMGPEILSSGAGKRLLWHFQTPVLYWINFQSARKV